MSLIDLTLTSGPAISLRSLTLATRESHILDHILPITGEVATDWVTTSVIYFMAVSASSGILGHDAWFD